MNISASLTKKIYGHNGRKPQKVEIMHCENCNRKFLARYARMCYTTKGNVKVCGECYYKYNRDNILP